MRSPLIIGIVVIVLILLGLWLYSSGFFTSVVDGFTAQREGHAGLPSCGSSTGQSEAKRAFESSPFAKQQGLSVVVISDVKTIEAGAEKVECTATVILNSTQTGALNYSFEPNASVGSWNYLIRFRFEPNP
jgi:hypothetical protein